MYIEFRPEGAVRQLLEQQAASFEHNLSYAQVIDCKFIDRIGNILNLLTVEKKLKFYLGGASEDLSHKVIFIVGKFDIFLIRSENLKLIG